MHLNCQLNANALLCGVFIFDRENAMSATLEVDSTLTERYQTTVPQTVRRALKLGKGDKIHYTIRSNGEVVLTRHTTSSASDPALSAFLTFLAVDITKHPERLKAMDASFVQKLQTLTEGVELDLDCPLTDDDE